MIFDLIQWTVYASGNDWLAQYLIPNLIHAQTAACNVAAHVLTCQQTPWG
jgi:hypothetical protein